MRGTIGSTKVGVRVFAALLFATAVAAIGGSSARAASLCVGSGSGCYTSIQAAINAAANGDTITVGSGTYVEPGHLLISGRSNLTIAGAGTGATIIDTSGVCSPGCPSHTYGIWMDASHNISLSGFTLQGPTAANSGGGTSGHGTGYGIHDSGGDHTSISDVTVQGSARSNLDFIGMDTVSLTHVTATGSGYGNGITFSDSRNVTVDGVSTSGNAWGGIALYATGTTYACGVDNVSIAHAVLGETNALYTGIDNASGHGSPCTITNVGADPADLPYWVTLSQGDPQTIYVKSLADATTVAAASSLLSPVVHAATDSVAGLSALSLSSGSLAPAFDPATTAYTASVGYDTSSVTVAGTPSTGATVTVGGSGGLAVGDNTVTVTATSADGTATKTYTVTITRAAAPAPAAPVVSAPVVTAPAVATPAVATPAVATPTEVATVLNRPESAVAPLGTAGTVLVSVGSATTSGAGVATAAAPVSVALSWSPAAFLTPVTVAMTPIPQAPMANGGTAPPIAVAGGFTLGDTVVQVNVTDDAGVAVTQFAAPLQIHISSLGAGVPAYSHDGTTWTTIPRLAASTLPAGQQDGYFVETDGSVDIYTRHATMFGLLADTQAPAKPAVAARIVGLELYLRVRASDNQRVTSYRVVVNGKLLKRTTGASLALTARAARFQIVAVDRAGNLSKASTAVVVVRAGAKPWELRVRG